MFCSIWEHLGLFGCLTRCKTGRTGAKVRATKSGQNFSATNATDRLRTGNDLRDQADLASTMSVTTGSWFSDGIGASGSLVVVGS